MNKFLLFIIFFIAQLLLSFEVAEAGFGVSPPYISSDKIRPGVHYEQTIRLLRSEADESLELEMIIDAPEIADWISFEGGDTSIMPAGILNMPIKVSIDVPLKADLGNYQGKIVIKTKSLDDQNAMISLSTGAEININFDLSDDVYNNLSVKNITIVDYNLPGIFLDKLSIFHFAKPLKINLTIENKGNIEDSPEKVVLDIFNINEGKLLESVTATKFEKIQPFETLDLVASFSPELKAGQYWGVTKVYDTNKIIYNNKLAFTVNETDKDAKNNKIIYLLIFLILSTIGVVFVKKIIKKNKLVQRS